LSGRSCEHFSSYSWAEIVPPDTCSRVINRAEQILGCRPENSRGANHRKSLGAAVNDLMRARQSMATRLCHLCRTEHLEWKGRRCDTCSAFFCFRGLYRHFDMNSTDVMRHAGLWICPKCSDTCNCRVGYFPASENIIAFPHMKGWVSIWHLAFSCQVLENCLLGRTLMYSLF
jgi:hypothetical protein